MCACGHPESRRGSLPIPSNEPPSYDRQDTEQDAIWSQEVQNTIDSTIQDLDPDLRQLSLNIWGESILAEGSACTLRLIYGVF